ncbi:nucleotidyltransferase family protein, partial [Magnetococcales bacterium HHB-1]
MINTLLAQFLPTKEETHWLQIVFGLQPWSAQNHTSEEIYAFFSKKRRLLPLLWWSVKQHRNHLPKTWRTTLRATALYEQKRTEVYRRAVKETLTILQSASLPIWITRGALFTETIYPRAGLRHCHDLDLLLLKPQKSTATGEQLKAHHFIQQSPHTWCHPSGLPVQLHTTLFQIPDFKLKPEDIAAQSTTLYTLETAYPETEISLIQTIVHAASNQSRKHLIWLCDAWYLLQKKNLNWNKILTMAQGRSWCWPLTLGLDYLAHQLQAPIPPDILAELHRQTQKLPPHAWSVCLFGVSLGYPGGLHSFLRNNKKSYKAIHPLLFPSPTLLYRVGEIKKKQDIFSYYLGHLTNCI